MKIPTVECVCRFESQITFDIFTPELPDGNFGLYVSSICRSCGGYRTTRIGEVAFPLMIKQTPQHAGIKMINTDIEKNEENTWMYG